MGYRLAPHLSFCRADGQLIFLDTKRDRYFCLRGALDASFEAWLSGIAPDARGRANLAGLAAQGVLADKSGPDATPDPCPTPEPARISLYDEARSAGRFPVLAAYGRFKCARIAVKAFGLATSLACVERRKRHSKSAPDATARAQLVADAFHGAARHATTRLHCLPHSIAVAHAMLARGAPALLVLGVRTRPFGAHAWVQLGELLINDSLDNVRDFTPIRLV